MTGSTLEIDDSIRCLCILNPILSSAPRTRFLPACGVVCITPLTIVSNLLSVISEYPNSSNVPDSWRRLRSVLEETPRIREISVHAKPKRRRLFASV